MLQCSSARVTVACMPRSSIGRCGGCKPAPWHVLHVLPTMLFTCTITYYRLNLPSGGWRRLQLVVERAALWLWLDDEPLVLGLPLARWRPTSAWRVGLHGSRASLHHVQWVDNLQLDSGASRHPYTKPTIIPCWGLTEHRSVGSAIDRGNPQRWTPHFLPGSRVFQSEESRILLCSLGLIWNSAPVSRYLLADVAARRHRRRYRLGPPPFEHFSSTAPRPSLPLRLCLRLSATHPL